LEKANELGIKVIYQGELIRLLDEKTISKKAIRAFFEGK